MKYLSVSFDRTVPREEGRSLFRDKIGPLTTPHTDVEEDGHWEPHLPSAPSFTGLPCITKRPKTTPRWGLPDGMGPLTQPNTRHEPLETLNTDRV